MQYHFRLRQFVTFDKFVRSESKLPGNSQAIETKRVQAQKAHNVYCSIKKKQG